MLTKDDVVDVPALRAAIDEATEGALYAMQYEAETNGLTPHIWAQIPQEGAQQGTTRLLFFATDAMGITKYFDYDVIKDEENIGARVRVAETIRDAKHAESYLREKFDRLDADLDPVKYRIEITKLN